MRVDEIKIKMLLILYFVVTKPVYQKDQLKLCLSRNFLALYLPFSDVLLKRCDERLLLHLHIVWLQHQL